MAGIILTKTSILKGLPADFRQSVYKLYGHVDPWKKEYKDCSTKYLPLIEHRPLILWLRGQLKD